MEAVIGTTLPVFIVMTVVIMGFAAFVTGQAMANTWRPLWQPAFYCFLLGFADRFFTFALFEGELLSLGGFIVDSAVLIVIGLLSYRLTLTRKMVTQYPWIYERAGLFGWREKGRT